MIAERTGMHRSARVSLNQTSWNYSKVQVRSYCTINHTSIHIVVFLTCVQISRCSTVQQGGVSGGGSAILQKGVGPLWEEGAGLCSVEGIFGRSGVRGQPQTTQRSRGSLRWKWNLQRSNENDICKGPPINPPSLSYTARHHSHLSQGRGHVCVWMIMKKPLGVFGQSMMMNSSLLSDGGLGSSLSLSLFGGNYEG